jgi:hypothetical protein
MFDSIMHGVSFHNSHALGNPLMIRHWTIIALLTLPLLFLQTAAALSLDEAAIEQLLKREIIGSRLAMEEVQTFTENRVPLMPEITSREQWQRDADKIRQRVLDEVVYRGQAAKWRDAETKVEWLDTIEGGPGYRIRKLRYEALPGLWIPALLYEPTELKGKMPVALNVNGHDGNGKAAVYKQIRCINQAKRGMLSLNVEWLGMGQLRSNDNAHYRMNQLDLCGTSGLAPYYLSMKRGIDVLLSHEHADPQRVAVAGLSGGGWQTIFISSLDTRVTLSNPVAGYSSFRTRARHLKDLGDSEQTPNDLATVADYTHLTAMLAPRAALLTYNIKDNCCFESGYALPPLLEAAKPVYDLYESPDRLRSHINHDPGTHNFERDNREALYRMIGDHFYTGSEQFDANEIACDNEVKTKEQLDVPLPDNNASLHSLAVDLLKSLSPRQPVPDNPASDKRWQEDQRRKLRETVRIRDYECSAVEHAVSEQDGVRVVHWRLRIGDSWTVPAVELSPPNAKSTAILVSDRGRAATAATAAKLLAGGQRVLAVDPFYFGESKIADKDFLFALLVAAVGDRPLGIQASQLTAISRWLHKQHGTAVAIHSDGPRSSTFALVAAAIEPASIAEFHSRGLAPLAEIIEQNRAVNEMPEMFCFGLLEHFDVPELVGLIQPRRFTLEGSN